MRVAQTDQGKQIIAENSAEFECLLTGANKLKPIREIGEGILHVLELRNSLRTHLVEQQSEAWKVIRSRSQYWNGPVVVADVYDTLNNTEIPVAPEFTQLAVRGLGRVAEMGPIGAYTNIVNPAVAQDMLRTYEASVSAADTNASQKEI